MTVDAKTVAGGLLVAFNGAAFSKYIDTIFRITNDLAQVDGRVRDLLILWGVPSALGLLGSAAFLWCEAKDVRNNLRNVSIGASIAGAVTPVLYLLYASRLVSI